MHTTSTTLLKTTLSLLHATGLAGLFSPLTRGAGAILMLHQVSPGEPAAFEPNRILRVTPDFLDQTIRQVLESGFDVLSLDEVTARLSSGKVGRPFVAFTLDDAYKDNLVHAYPVFKTYGLPFTVYAPTDYIDGKGELWWLGLERALAALTSAEIEMDGVQRSFQLATAREKNIAYDKIYWWLRSIDETVARQKVRELCVTAGICLNTLCRDLIMDWEELRHLAADPLVTIGGHTRRHYAVGRLGPGAARAEIVEGITRLEKELSRPIRHFSFPFGDETSAGPRDFAIARDLGFATAVTTRKGVVHLEHKDALHALPRLSLNGDFQHARYVEVLLSGLPFRLRDFARGFSAKPSAG
jgi:peptidoglycan/xylan/chitin deacetylase (PgdA/CDA1 family)